MEGHRLLEQEIPGFDEGWWASVLADEESAARSDAVHQPMVDVRANSILDWEKARELYLHDQIVSLKVTGYNRGGVLVEGDGLYGFVPCSHLLEFPVQPDTEEREKFLSAYIGRPVRLKVIECVQEDGRMVFSERAAKAEAGRRAQLFNTLQVGQCIAGEVTNITEFGAFIDLGGVEGLIHISELSWGRVAHPAQVLHLGDKVDVMVMEIAPERCRIALSLKRLHPNPWESVKTRYDLQQIVRAEITTLVPYGAFARLEDGLEGLIHISEIPVPNNAGLKDILVPGQKVEVRILQIDVNRQRFGLSLRLD